MTALLNGPARRRVGHPTAMVAVADLTYHFPGAATPALAGVDLTIAPGEFVVLAGASGSGKSTLLRALSGLVPHFHGGRFSGHVHINGADTREHRPAELARHVASLFQDPETQIVMGSVRAELAFALENRGWGASEIARAVEEIALSLAIDGLLDRSTAELSGGELQRVALGATLVGRPRLVCLDEPTSQLDPVAGDELIGLLRRLNEDGDLTIVMSEHRLERCLAVADRVIALDGGRLVADRDPDRFLAWALERMPALATPGAALLARAGAQPVAGVKRARAALANLEALEGQQARPAAVATPATSAGRPVSLPVSAEPHRRGWRGPRGRRRDVARGPSALEFRGVWHELRQGPTVLAGVDLRLEPGERVALMGANGAGKSTLLRHAAGLLEPTRGQVLAPAGRVALLLQNPNDYLVHERVEEEAKADALARFGLAQLAHRHPRDLSGGERQRLALAIVWGEEAPALLCLDEPTRGMDRQSRDALCALLAASPSAVLVATHDPELAARCADRVLLMAAGAIIADDRPEVLLARGTYFATEAARITDGRVLVS